MIESLIQIHYHLRTGGVTTVIRRYSEAFSKLTMGKSELFVFCNGNAFAGDINSKIIHVKKCDYFTYKEKNEFYNDRMIIESYLEKCISEQQKKGRVIVVAHNLALGKNLALTSAFYNCAKKNTLNSVTFFSVFHDFPEEGRVDELDAIRDVGRFKSNIKKQMYCIDAPVKIVVPNVNAMRMMLECGFNVSMVSNPVSCKKVGINSNKIEYIHNSILHHAHKLKLPFDKHKTVAYYPVRIIPRKNIYEAILISCIFFNSSLITGPSGNSEQDSNHYRNLIDFIKRNRLPVMTDVIKECGLQNNYNEIPVENIMLAADYILSTSVAEGFGYTLFEPWIQQKTLIARKNPGLDMPDGWNGESMYSFLPVPVKWIDIERVVQCYEMYYVKCFKKEISWSVKKSFIHGEFIDFAVLPECIQKSIIELIITDNKIRSEWLTIIEDNIYGWPGLQNVYNNAKRSIKHHSDIVASEFNERVFKKEFSEVFLQGTPKSSYNAAYQKIEVHFQSPEYFRLLLGNQDCRMCDS
ncbi:MAG: hypothetical protein GX639_06535 [Fibrobacter sp.]|nr:hypothetical protein [Fibrobacter sp.]